MAKQIIIKGTAVTGANEVLVADSNSKIPAVDGSLVTAMSGTNVGSGTIATARLDTGTAANKIVVLDGSAKIPAVDGSLLTGIVSYTKSASDPTISTNPSGGVGTEWVNTSTGKQFICTDATAGANVWSCSGSHSGDLIPYSYQGSSYGYHVGNTGSTPTTGIINKHSFTSDGNATAAGSLIGTGQYGGIPHSTASHGYYCEAWAGTRIEKWTFASDGSGVDAGQDLMANVWYGAGAKTEAYGYVLGGTERPPDYSSEKIQKFQFDTSNNATDIGNLTVLTSSNTAGASSSTHGYCAGGITYSASPAVYLDVINKTSFSTDGNATDVGNLLTNNYLPGGSNSTTYGYVHGGFYIPPSETYIDVIQKYAFASDGNATDVGNLTQIIHACGGSSSTTYGYRYGGQQTGSARKNVIDKYAFASDGNATDVGDLLYTMNYGNGGWQI